MELPFVLPLSLWKKTGRHEIVADELIRLSDRTGRELLLASSHLEGMTELIRLTLRSSDDLPAFLFQFQRKFRDEKNLRGGILRAKEFLMKDAYSFHRSFTELNTFFPKVFAAYERIFQRCGIDVIAAESAVGSITGDKAYEFLMLTEAGDDILIRCPGCGYSANRDVGIGIKNYFYANPEPLKEFEVTEKRPLSTFMEEENLTESRVIKTRLYRVYEGFALASVLQGYEISTEKLSRFLNKAVIREASSQEYKNFGFLKNFFGPVGLDGTIPLVVDDAVAWSDNLLTGANRKNTYLSNVNFGRDFETPLVGDIVRSKPGNRCRICGTPLESVRALELGNIFRLGDFFPRSLGLSFTDRAGREKYPSMGSYGIGLGRLMGAIVEAHHDEKGIDWPVGLEPYVFYLSGSGKSPRVKKALEEIYQRFPSDSLYNDSAVDEDRASAVPDLMGIPFRITVSAETLEKGGVFLSRRRKEKIRFIPQDDLPEEMKKLLEQNKEAH